MQQEDLSGLDAHLWEAVEAFGGGFALMRAIRTGGEGVDWELLYANEFVRERWLGTLPEPGARSSDDGMRFGLSDMAGLQRAALETRSTQQSAILVDAPGGAAWRRVVCIPVGDDVVASMTHDISDFEDVEEHIEARKHSEAALRASEARTRSILETAADGIITLDQDGVVETINQAAERMFQTRAIDVIGRAYPHFIPAHVAEAMRQGLSLAGKQLRPVETVGLRPDNTEFPIQVSLSSTMIDGRTVYTAIVRDITRQRQIEQQLEHMALHDDLTGLPNRRALVERLRSMVSRPAATAGHVVGLLSINLDDFKLVNDSLGHEVGDRLVSRVAQRIACSLEPGDVLGRPGGDEFIVLCDVRRSVDSLVRLANRIANQLRAPFEIDRHEVFVSASIGIATSRGDETSLELLRNADTAMHRAKQRGRGQVEVFDQRMRIELAARLGLESALQRALERDELRAVYQPIVDLAFGEVVKYEALVRWMRPDVGLLPPADFIEVAEETGLIIPIGEWMLNRATADAAEWQDTQPGVGVSVNVSGRQLDRTDFPSAVANALRVSKLPPHLLTLEFTESVLIRDEDRIVATFEELRALGVRLAIDDFGTGYSSLMYLHRLPLDELKIDGSFIQTLDVSDEQHPLVAMMVQLGEALGLDTVAEGIDSAEKADVVRKLGSTCGQGFHFARPAPR